MEFLMKLIIPKSLKNKENLLKQVSDMAEVFYAKNDSAHDFSHACRVTRLALKLGQQEVGNLELLFLGGILHDTGRYEQVLTGVCHAKFGAEIAKSILTKLGYPAGVIENVQEMIRTHRFRVNNIPKTLEAKILFDADKLDAIGAIGIARAYAVAGRRNQRLHATGTDINLDEDSKNYSPESEYNLKLKKIKDRLLTSAGLEEAKVRDRFMKSFFAELRREVKD